MPYINQARREELNLYRTIDDIHPQTVGELNYVITSMVLDFLPIDANYEQLNSVIGVLEAAKLEFYRRRVAPYEDQKIRENGDVYS